MKDIKKLVYSLIICLSAGIIGSFFTSSSIPIWYTALNKPFFNPPNWIFGPVWTLLYVLMGISLYIVWTKGFKKNKEAIIWFAAQLILNILWSILFFGLKSPLLAFVEIILLWIAILITLIKFYKVSKQSAYLLIPYLAWVGFAAILNFSIFYLNI